MYVCMCKYVYIYRKKEKKEKGEMEGGTGRWAETGRRWEGRGVALEEADHTQSLGFLFFLLPIYKYRKSET